MQTINPDLPDLKDVQQQVTELRDRMSKVEGAIQQINRIALDGARQTIWQFVIFTVTMAGILIGALNYQTNTLRKEFDVRFEKVEERITLMEKRLDQRIDQLEKRLEQSEKNILARFEDLKQEVRNRK